jgi:hypothetical protein
MSTTRSFWCAGLASLVATTVASAPTAAQQPVRKSNAVFILADNVGPPSRGQRRRELSGTPTPRIEQLAREGLRRYQPGQVPFAATSNWNTPIPSNAIYTTINWPASTGYNYSVAGGNGGGGASAVFISAGSDPMVAVRCRATWGWPANPSLRIPSGATSTPSDTDGEILIVDNSTNTVWNFWQFTRTSDTTATASAYARTNIQTGTGWGIPGSRRAAGITAVGSSVLAGLLVQAETDQGVINHAIEIVSEMDITMTGFDRTWGAVSGDGRSASGVVQEGWRVGIPPGTPMPQGDNGPLSPQGQMVFNALKTYGGYIVDVAGGVTNIRAQQNAVGYDHTWGNALWHDMGHIMPLTKKVTLP